MASWRVVGDSEIWDAISKIQDTLLIAALQFLSGRVRHSPSAVRADAHLDRLASMRLLVGQRSGDAVPCEVPTAAGAFYCFPVSAFLDPLVLTERLIREHRVAVVPGTAFGDNSACSIRVSMARRTSSVEEDAPARRRLKALAVT
jgi:aspartate/methionine/tyrosine aminotransferase